MEHYFLVHLHKGNSYVRTAPFVFENEKAAHLFCLGIKKEYSCVIENVGVISEDIVKKVMLKFDLL